ncbi:MAG: ABC transporter ATP-binding protein [Acidobacteria bacterium]|nr:MAG: ABC transporter ATP-binding protein [Acidobacteriota bacterium]REK12136.1 MAG: ABC transporter ATP-binding protein [Acidobacteriota bacterium]
MPAAAASARAEAREPTDAIWCEGVGRRFGRRWALAHVDLRVRTGETTVIVGANGSGKTTLLRILAALCHPSCGRIEVAGHHPVTQRTRVRRQVSLISHQSFLYGGLDAFETVALWTRLLEAQGEPPVGRQRIAELLDSVGLGHVAGVPVRDFSQGMRKRLSLLRAAIEPSRIVLLDEPFAALDPPGQQLISEWIGVFGRAGRTVVFASHALAAARQLATRAVVLQSGQVAWSGPAAAMPELGQLPALRAAEGR